MVLIKWDDIHDVVLHKSLDETGPSVALVIKISAGNNLVNSDYVSTARLRWRKYLKPEALEDAVVIEVGAWNKVPEDVVRTILRYLHNSEDRISLRERGGV